MKTYSHMLPPRGGQKERRAARQENLKKFMSEGGTAEEFYLGTGVLRPKQWSGTTLRQTGRMRGKKYMSPKEFRELPAKDKAESKDKTLFGKKKTSPSVDKDFKKRRYGKTSYIAAPGYKGDDKFGG